MRKRETLDRQYLKATKPGSVIRRRSNGQLFMRIESDPYAGIFELSVVRLADGRIDHMSSYLDFEVTDPLDQTFEVLGTVSEIIANYQHLCRKVSHGCIDANCSECDH